MLKVLYGAEKALLELLDNEDTWHGLDIDYESPRVERLWMSLGEYRVNLHCIHTCKPGEALFHPHPWPSAMRMLGNGMSGGEYEMQVGYGSGHMAPPVAMTLVLTKGAAYEMTHQDTWHAVRPLYDQYSFSLMVTGTPWGRQSPKSDRKLSPLSNSRRKVMFAVFREFYKIPERYIPSVEGTYPGPGPGT
jgi:hypothetical protein